MRRMTMVAAVLAVGALSACKSTDVERTDESIGSFTQGRIDVVEDTARGVVCYRTGYGLSCLRMTQHDRDVATIRDDLRALRVSPGCEEARRNVAEQLAFVATVPPRLDAAQALLYHLQQQEREACS